ncbi:MAG: hypothetical protein A2Y79_10515 [Deltaproteobacteria bacterium RBG_13_43_22]|nr:MAG: hypothetical protein A2Y79_10515 [Deltaproteobacteria bacterium RBG_13_43_22]
MFFDVVQKAIHRPIPAQKLSSLEAGREAPRSPKPVSGNGPGGPQGPAFGLMFKFWPGKEALGL